MKERTKKPLDGRRRCCHCSFSFCSPLSVSPSFLAFSLSLALLRSLIIICLLLVARCRLCRRLCRHTGNDLSRRLDTHATATAAASSSSPDQTAIGELLVAARLPPWASVSKGKRNEQHSSRQNMNVCLSSIWLFLTKRLKSSSQVANIAQITFTCSSNFYSSHPSYL